MDLTCSVDINASAEKIWSIITNIDNCANTISGINSVEVLERPASGVVGLKWKETRTMFGKQASETMWITEAVENEFYKTRAESHGMIYETKMAIASNGDSCELSMSFGGTPQTGMAKFMMFLTAKMMKKATVKALTKDLNDIKTAAES
ncbi:MAG: SRPBCC family protein [Bacteroidetes bacterium]|nr:SRPBCC family protein [Bacteroidota bacterium]